MSISYKPSYILVGYFCAWHTRAFYINQNTKKIRQFLLLRLTFNIITREKSNIMNDLPIEIIHIIVDHLDLKDYTLCYHYSLDILHLSRVNHYLSEILWQDPSFYHRQWRKYLSIDVPAISPSELRQKYYQSLKKLNLQPNDYMRLIIAIREGWDHVFTRLFRSCDFSSDMIGDPLSTYDVNGNPEDYYPEFDATKERRINVLLLATIKHGRIEMMDTLLNSGAMMDTSRYNSITLAVQYDQTRVFERLIDRGAIVIRSTFTRFASLIPTIALASKYGRLEIVNYLIGLGEDVTLYNDMALRIALENQHIEVAERLIDAGSDVSPYENYNLQFVAGNGLNRTMKFLLDPKKKDSRIYQDALVMASKNGHLDIVNLFLDIGVDPQDESGCMALFEATRNDHPDIVKGLLQCNLRSSTIRESCWCALEKGNTFIFELLVKADLTQQDIDMLYRVAEKKKNIRAMNLLALRGAKMANNAFHLRW